MRASEVEKPEIAIQFRQVSYQLAEAKILSHLAFEIHQGETVVLVGRSGSGKTTTLKLVNRLLEPTQGEVLVQNRTTTSWDPIELRRRIGYVIQDVGLFPHFTVERNVALVPSLEGWEQEKLGRRVRELLTLVGPGWGRVCPSLSLAVIGRAKTKGRGGPGSGCRSPDAAHG